MKKTERTNKNRTYKGHILGLINTLEPGQSFLTFAAPNTCQVYAGIYEKKINTSIKLLIDPKTLIIEKITLVTVK